MHNIVVAKVKMQKSSKKPIGGLLIKNSTGKIAPVKIAIATQKQHHNVNVIFLMTWVQYCNKDTIFLMVNIAQSPLKVLI